jgi:hypothetical protein
MGRIANTVGQAPVAGPRDASLGRVLDALLLTHLAVSVIASWSVVFLVRPGRRWIAWAAILGIGFLTLATWIGARMAIAGAVL